MSSFYTARNCLGRNMSACHKNSHQKIKNPKRNMNEIQTLNLNVK